MTPGESDPMDVHVPFTIAPTGGALGAEVGGLDLSKPLSAERLATLEEAVGRYGVVLFREQVLTEPQQLALSRAFGQVDIPHFHSRMAPRLADGEEASPVHVGDCTVYLTDGPRFRDPSDPEPPDPLRLELWHTDLSFLPEPLCYTLLYAVEAPARGGETEFASLTAAYDALDDALKDRISGLYAVHTLKEAGPSARHPLVRIHPLTGRRYLYVNPKLTRRIEGLPEAEGRELLGRLCEAAIADRFVWSFRWEPGALLMWDNRCTLHRRRPLDASCSRVLRRTQAKLDRDVGS